MLDRPVYKDRFPVAALADTLRREGKRSMFTRIIADGAASKAQCQARVATRKVPAMCAKAFSFRPSPSYIRRFPLGHASISVPENEASCAEICAVLHGNYENLEGKNWQQIAYYSKGVLDLFGSLPCAHLRTKIEEIIATDLPYIDIGNTHGFLIRP